MGVSVLERAERIEPLGAGLSIWPNGVKALRALGLGELADEAPRGGGALRRADGSALAEFDPEAIAERYGAPLVGVHRADLHDALIAALGPERIELGTEVSGGTGHELTLAGGATRDADLIVGADGISSVSPPSADRRRPPARLGDRRVPGSGDVRRRRRGGRVVGRRLDRRPAAAWRRSGLLVRRVPRRARAGRARPAGGRLRAAGRRDRRGDGARGGSRPPPLRPPCDQRLEHRADDAARRRRPRDAPVPRPGRLRGARGRRRAREGAARPRRRHRRDRGVRVRALPADRGAGPRLFPRRRGSRSRARASAAGSATRWSRGPRRACAGASSTRRSTAERRRQRRVRHFRLPGQSSAPASAGRARPRPARPGRRAAPRRRRGSPTGPGPAPRSRSAARRRPRSCRGGRSG